jgi:uncharacterized membrane protein YeaQ/YmgE (transglycosylase-associated protein family)
MKKLAIVIVTSLLASCATNRQSIMGLSMGLGLAGGIVESARAPTGENKENHFLLGAAVLGLVGAAAGLYIFDEQKAHEQTKQSLSLTTAKLMSCNEGEAKSKKARDDLNNGADLPLTLKTMLQNGSGKFSKIDRWIDSGSGELIHQDQKIEVTH